VSQPTNTLQTLDFAAIGAYLGGLAVLGLVLGRLIKDVGAYFKGGGTLPWPAAAVSNYMAMFSTFIFVAYAGIAFDYGLVSIIVFWCTVPPTLVAAVYIGKRWRRAGIMTPVEYLETRFNTPVRQFLGWCGIVFRVLDNMVRLYATAVFVAAASQLSPTASIVVAGSVVLIYTVSGGLWAVVLIDVVQFVILMSATLIMFPLSLHAAGGLSSMMEQIPEHFHWFNGPKGTWLFLLAYYAMVLIKYNGNWAFIQRFYSVRDENAGRKMGLLMGVLFFVSPVFFLLPAIAARGVFPQLANHEAAYVTMALHVLPPGIMGLMIAAMFAATMSSLDSDYNVTAGVFTRDVYHRVLRPTAGNRELMWVARVTTIVIGVLVMFGALFVGRFGGAFTANMVLTGLAIPLSVPLVLGILSRSANPLGAVATVLIGVPVGLVLTFLQPHMSADKDTAWALTTLAVIVVSVGVFYLSGLLPRAESDRRRIGKFFDKLQTPLCEEEKPKADPAFRRSLTLIFSAALLSTGLLFSGMALPSVGQISGRLALVAGSISLVLSLVTYRLAGRPPAKPVETLSPLRIGNQR
jgi:SSS family transporter